jgi:hypothetical protein
MTCATAASAADFGDGMLSVNGAGSMVYAVTDGNTVQNGAFVGTSEGNFQNAEFNLTLMAKLLPNVTIDTQLFFDDFAQQVGTGVDWTFVQVRLANWLTLRGGKIKLPFGISNEVQTVGTLRPFLALPASVYGLTGLTAEAYYGAGITGDFVLGSGWGVSYDLYGGELDVTLSPEKVQLAQLFAPASTVQDHNDVRNLAGGRLVVSLPIDGLSARLSGYRGTLNGTTAIMALASLEYQSERWLLRAEGFRATESSNFLLGGYAEAAYRLLPKVEIAAQFDGVRMHGLMPASRFLRHESGSLGLNYWLSPSLVFKVELTRIHGNMLAVPPNVVTAIMAGTPIPEDTTLLAVGTQFSF